MMYRMTVANTTGTAGGWTSGSANDSNIPANTTMVRYFSMPDNNDAVGLNNDSLVIANVSIADINHTSNSIVSTRAQITSGFYVKLEALPGGDATITIWEEDNT